MDSEVSRLLAAAIKTASRRGTAISLIKLLMEFVMSTQQDLENELASLKAAIQADQQTDQQAVDALEQNIADLKSQIANGTDTSATITELEAIKALIQPVNVTPATPTSPPATTPPGETPVPTSSKPAGS